MSNDIAARQYTIEHQDSDMYYSQVVGIFLLEQLIYKMEKNLDELLENDQEIFEYEKESENILIKSLRNFKVALMGTLFVMASDSTMSFRVNLIGMIIDFL